VHNTTAQLKIDEQNNAKRLWLLALVQSVPDSEVQWAFLWLTAQHTTSEFRFRAAELC